MNNFSVKGELKIYINELSHSILLQLLWCFSLSLSLSIYIYIYIYTHTHRHTQLWLKYNAESVFNQ